MNVEDPLLEKDESENEYDDTAPLRHRRTSSSKEIQLWPWSVHFVLFTAYTIAFALFAKNERSFRSHIERSQVYCQLQNRKSDLYINHSADNAVSTCQTSTETREADILVAH